MNDGECNALINCSEDPSSFKKYILYSVKDAQAKSLFGEKLERLGPDRLLRFLESLKKLVTDSIVDVNQDAENVYAAVQIIELLMGKINSGPQIASILNYLHGVLLLFSDQNMFIQNCCCQVLEKYWKMNLHSKNTAAVNVIPYLLARALCPIGKTQDVIRLCEVKEMLELIDFQCLSSASLVSLLCKAASSEVFLKNKQGIEFLSYILTIDLDLMVMVNNAITFMIPDLKDAHLLKVGEIYYEGIELAKTRNCMSQYEKECIQGLIVCALHCHRVGSNKCSQKVAKVLSVLHKHKKEPHIEEMLYTLYKPLLWRALDAPNGDVRANATALFLGVFPLIPARYNKVQFQDTLEEQCSKIKELMMDDHEAVRVCATQGCAQILEDFWKILPAHHLTTLLTTLCCDMTHDMSSSEVVVAALQGVQLLLNNPLSHVALKKLLPALSNHIYHPAVSVRNVMVSLLLTLHQTSIFKFWDLVPAEDLLSIVENTKPGPIRQKIVSLLVHLYFPVDESLSVQIQITLDMLRKCPDVHRSFYLDAYPHVGLSSSLRLVVGLMLLIKECIEKGSVTLSEDSKLHINSDEVEKVGQVLEVCAVLLNSAGKDLKRNKQAASTLCSKIVPLIPRILQEFGSDSVCNEALSLIMTNLPNEGLVLLKKQCYKMCKDKTSGVPVQTSASLALIRIGGGTKILSHWSEVISSKLESILDCKIANPSALNSVDAPSKETTQVLQTISNVLESPEYRTLMECSALDNLYSVLFSTVDLLPQYHVLGQSQRLRADHFKILVDCLALTARFSIHIGGVEDLILIAKTITNVVDNTKSGNSNRSTILNNVYKIVVEGFQVLQYSPDLLSLLHHISTSLADSEISSHRLTLCKYLHRAAHFLGIHTRSENLREVFVRVLQSAAQNTSKKELKDVECLLLEVGVTVQRRELGKSKRRPWDGVAQDIAQVVTESLDPPDNEISSRSDLSPLLQIIVDCIERSDSFSFSFLPALQTAALTNPGVAQLLNLISP